MSESRRPSRPATIAAAICLSLVVAGRSIAQAPPATITTQVWNDTDNDGLLDNGEGGFQNVTVQLLSADGSTLLATATTDSGGFATLQTPVAGPYALRLPAIDFNPGGILRDYRSSTGPLPTVPYEPAPDPDANATDGDDNGTEANGLLGLGGYIQSAAFDVSSGTRSDVDFGVNNEPQLDLHVTKTDNQPTYQPGATLHYAVVVTNNGPADADGMTVHDERPAQIVSWSWACAPGTPPAYDCTGDAGNPATFTDSLTLPAPQFDGNTLVIASVTYDVTAQVATSVSGDLLNSVYVVPPAGMSDLTPPDNVANDIDTLAAADLAVTKDDGETTYLPGGTLTYEVTVHNGGPADAGGVTVTDARPAQIASWTWTCAPGTPAAYNCSDDASNPVTFTDSLDLPADASVTYEVVAQVAGGVTGSLTNSVTVALPQTLFELDNTNDTAIDDDALAATTLSITKVAAGGPVAAGSPLTFTIQVNNTGSAPATMLVVTDALPAGLAFSSATGTGWSCGEAGGVVTCTRPQLDPGPAPPIQLVVTASSVVTNAVTVSAANAPSASTTAAPVPVQPIPALDWRGLLALAALLACATVWRLRRQAGD